MLRIVPSTSPGAAVAYFNEGLKKGDYYTADEAISMWHGKAAALLGLSGPVTAQQFDALAYNRHPDTNLQLTPRMRDGRVVGWDFNFHAPKSFSLMLALHDRENLTRVLREAVARTMDEIERMAMTRVRRDGAQDDRVTGNLVWGEFVHFLARPVNGLPSPHAHVHAYTFNLTMDEEEGRWKAAKISDIKAMAPVFEAYFHSHLSNLTRQLGYGVAVTGYQWEIDGIPRSAIVKNSERTAEVEAEAKRLGITDAKQRDELGAKTRSHKGKGMTIEKQLEAWNARMEAGELAAIRHVFENRLAPGEGRIVTARQAVDFAEGKSFERASVAKRDDLTKAALKFGFGSVLPAQVEAEMQRRGYIEKEIKGQRLCTTMAHVVEEVDLVEYVRNGRNRHAPLVPGKLDLSGTGLRAEQQEAARQILKSKDQVILLEGKAGVGKTFLLKSIKPMIEAEGTRVFAFAPSATASRGELRKEGFDNADTIQRLLVDKRLQQQVRGKILLIDEAGLVGIRQMAQIKEIAGQSTRIIVCGDTGQHAPVPRGDVMRLMQTFSHANVITLDDIIRQKEEGYKQAIEALAQRNMADAFDRLAEIGAIVEIPNHEARYHRLASDWFAKRQETGKDPLVVSPTHAEATLVTNAIRSRLAEERKLGTERQLLQYRQMHFSEAEKGWAGSYDTRMVVRYHQNVRGIIRGRILPVEEVNQSEVWLKDHDGSRRMLDLKTARHFEVFETSEISIARGDRIRITTGGTSDNGRRLQTGDTSSVKKFLRNGSLQLENGVILAADHGHIAHGYVSTSHSSQGKTVRDVFVAQLSTSVLAGTQEQFYVSASRAEQSIRIYTDNRDVMQAGVTVRSSRRESALEFTGAGEELFMGGLNGTEWSKRIASHRAQLREGNVSYVQKVAEAGRINPLKKDNTVSYSNYIDARRAMAGPDGKNRAKGHPQPPDAKKGKKGITVPKRVQMRDDTADLARRNAEMKQPEQKPAKLTPHENRVGKAMKAASSKLKEVVERSHTKVKAAAQGAKRAIQFGNLKTTMGNVNGAKAQEAAIKHNANPPTKAPPKNTPPPPAPVIRRGR